MPSTNINNSFFQGSYKEAWRNLIPAGLTEAEADFIVDVASLQPGDPVLDLMCGYGRHSFELAKRGMNVTAVDNLKEYIEEINEKADSLNHSVQGVQGDILYFEPQGIYKAAICMGNSFAFFNRNDALTILKTIAGHLTLDGVLVINSWMIAEIAIKYFKERDWHYAGDYKCMLDYRFEFHPSRIESEQTVISPDGSVETIQGIDYIFTLDELDIMFQEAGLRLKESFSTPRKRKFSFGDVRIYMVIEKLS